jgi:hypothetical protein
MKEKIKLFLLVILLLFLFTLSISNTEARSGCCSHHGGVCGCHCCDGTSLSATCAPYYPQCNRAVAPSTDNQPPAAQNNSSDNSLSPNKFTAEIPKENSGNSFWWWIIGIGFAGYLFYVFKKKK